MANGDPKAETPLVSAELKSDDRICKIECTIAKYQGGIRVLSAVGAVVVTIAGLFATWCVTKVKEINEIPSRVQESLQKEIDRVGAARIVLGEVSVTIGQAPVLKSKDLHWTGSPPPPLGPNGVSYDIEFNNPFDEEPRIIAMITAFDAQGIGAGHDRVEFQALVTGPNKTHFFLELGGERQVYKSCTVSVVAVGRPQVKKQE